MPCGCVACARQPRSAAVTEPPEIDASGGGLTVCDGTNVISEAGVEAQRLYNESGAVPYRLRSPEQIAEFFEGLELVEPGVVSCPRWPPDPRELASGAPAEMDQFAGVARKP